MHRPALENNMASPRPVIASAIAIIKQYEGFPTKNGMACPYLDPIGIWTIGWGHAIVSEGRFLRGNADLAKVKALYPDGITTQQAATLLDADLLHTGSEVLALVVVPLSDNQYGALTSFTFNLGSQNLRSSTLLKDLNASDYGAAADEFPRWCHANGKVMAGLVQRRNAERTLFLT
jgi:lysozyme